MQIRSIFLAPALSAGLIFAGSAFAQTTDAVPPAAPAAEAAAAAPADAAANDAPEAADADADAEEGDDAAAPMANAPGAPVTMKADGRPDWMPEVKADKGLVIIFRESHLVGSAVAMKVLADEGVVLPKLKNGRIVYFYFEPGDHTLYSDKKKQRDARILGVEAGQVYFFEGRWETNMWRKADVDLVPVAYDEGVQRIGKFKARYPVGPTAAP